MMKKTMVGALLAVSCLISQGLAADPNCRNAYIVPGRQAMFEGTLSGLREAYQLFEAGKHSSICSGDRELALLHALTRMTMWVARDDGNQIDSVLELAREFGITLSGDYIKELNINPPPYPAARYGNFVMPAQTPHYNELKAYFYDELMPGLEDFTAGLAIPEINAVIVELNSITESTNDRFRIFFSPSETGLKGNLEVDYADVLLLKGVLYALKSHLETGNAYDTFIDPNDLIIEKLFAGNLKIGDDLLTLYPNLLKVLPTPGHPVDGKAILAQARQDMINGIDYYREAINYMLSEDDPQEDDFLSVDPRLYELKDKMDNELGALRNSLIAGTSITHATNITDTFSVIDSGSNNVGTLVLKYDAFGRVEGGQFDFVILDQMVSTSWDIDNVTIDDFGFIAEMDLKTDWGGAVLAGTISADRKKISNATFDYWGGYLGQATGLIANLTGTETENVRFNINPVFGSSPGYSTPVNPRDSLPEFGPWNNPKIGTFGKGLGNDATLGGILPLFTQQNWLSYLDLQPGGLIYLQEVFNPMHRRYYDGEKFYGIWDSSQLVFTDPRGDAAEDSTLVRNVDIAGLYMGYDDDAIYGTIFLHNYIYPNEYDTDYELYLSYNPGNTNTLGSIKLRISCSGDSGNGELSYLSAEYGPPQWNYIDAFPVHVSQGGIDFKIPWNIMPDFLPGRFITLNSHGYNYDWETDAGERNSTYLQIGEVGRISGTIACDTATYKGDPIVIEAYTDSHDPKGTLVASTIIDGPGPYELTGVGLGWYGWIRASMPCHQFDVRGIDTWQIESVTSVFVAAVDTPNIDLSLGPCVSACETATQISIGVPHSGYAPYQKETWHSFIADTSTVFSILGVDMDGEIAIFDGCGGKELISGYFYEELLRFNAQQGRTYYVRIKPSGQAGPYTVTLFHYGPAIANDNCANALDITTDVNYTGTTNDATRDGKSSCGYGDDYDVWFRFTPATDGVYEANFTTEYFESTVSVYEECDGNEIVCANFYDNVKGYLNMAAGKSYYIRLANNWRQTGPYSFQIHYFGPPVENNLCVDAIAIVEGQTLAGSTLGAIDGDVWYQFTPANSGIYDVNLVGNAYAEVFDDCNENGTPMGNFYAWPQYFKAQAGKPYLIKIVGWDLGDFTLQLIYTGAGVANDDKKDAQPIDAGNSYSGTTDRATKDGKSVCGEDSGPDVWYLFVPVNSGVYKVKFTDSSSDMGLSVSQPPMLGWLDKQDNLACLRSWDEQATYFLARAGLPYYIRVAAYWDETGSFTFALDEVSVPSSAVDLTGDNVVDSLDLSWFFYYWLSDCPQPYWCRGSDLNANFVVDFEDFAVLASRWLETNQ
jgi:hypothetical protein